MQGSRMQILPKLQSARRWGYGFGPGFLETISGVPHEFEPDPHGSFCRHAYYDSRGRYAWTCNMQRADHLDNA